MVRFIEPCKKVKLVTEVPPDKSISHRAVMLGAIAEGRTCVYNPLMSEDVLSTVDCMRKLGADIETEDKKIIVSGIKSFNNTALYAGNSGTTMRLLCGVLSAAEGGRFTLSGDASLSKRPMMRVIKPLGLMGASIESDGGLAPLGIAGRRLRGIDYAMPVDSAQVKSAILLAGLYADGETRVIEKIQSRNHTELMLKMMGAEIHCEKTAVTVKRSRLKGIDVCVPGDISSAAFMLVMAAARDGGYAKLLNVGVNPTRTGIFKVMREAGVDFDVVMRGSGGESVADIEVQGRKGLKAFTVTARDIPSLVDEIPAIAVLACFCGGETVISGAGELKVKESNRIDTVVNALKLLGADITATDDGMIIRGRETLRGGAQIETCGDHRIAMSMAVAGALSEQGAYIADAECVSVSFPDFYEVLAMPAMSGVK